jgi:Pectate lyase superfamily protein
MSSNVTKRTLSAGLGVGALALLAPRASADTPFSSFAFRATGAPTARTLPDRLGELKNVKDFGARGDGSTNDTAAIQAAVDQQGTIYFPPGQYRITRPISLAPEGAQYDLVGARSFIFGDFDGYLFDCPAQVGDGPLHFSVQNFSMRNNRQSPNAGCIRLTRGIVSRVEYCSFEAWRPLSLVSIYGGAVRDCVFHGLNSLEQSGIAEKASIAIYAQGTMLVENCDINGYYEGIRTRDGISIHDTRIEQCYRGIVVGMTEDGGDYPAYIIIDGVQMEARVCTRIIY